MKEAILLCALVLLSITDLLNRKIPNFILIILILIWMVCSGISVISDPLKSIDILLPSLIGAAEGGFLFYIIYRISRKRLGAGDVKLVFVLGLYLTKEKIMEMIFCSMALCCIYVLIQMIRKKMDRKSELPLAPFLFAGTILTLLIEILFPAGGL